MKPKEIVFLRHGLAETNIAIDKILNSENVPKEFYVRHDSCFRLSEKGVNQAKAAGEYLKTFSFSDCYVSPFVRALETAYNLNIDADWHVNDLLRERSWGEYSILSAEQSRPGWEITHKAKDQSFWYWTPPGGESMASEARMRVMAFLETLEDNKDEKVLVVSHGEWMHIARVIIEGLLPYQWELEQQNNQNNIVNCQILHYSRVNPLTGEEHYDYKWMKGICPYDSSLSWNNGDWKEIKTQTYSRKQLLDLIEPFTSIFDV